MPAGWDNASADWNLWLKSWPCLKLHALSLCLNFLWVAGAGHDTAIGMRTQIKWTITHILIELSAPALSIFFIFFWQTWQVCVSSSPFYVPTIGFCCNSLRNIIKTRLIPVSSIIFTLWKHDLGGLPFVWSDNVCLMCATLEKQVKLVDQNLLAVIWLVPV